MRRIVKVALVCVVAAVVLVVLISLFAPVSELPWHPATSYVVVGSISGGRPQNSELWLVLEDVLIQSAPELSPGCTVVVTYPAEFPIEGAYKYRWKMWLDSFVVEPGSTYAYLPLRDWENLGLTLRLVG